MTAQEAGLGLQKLYADARALTREVERLYGKSEEPAEYLWAALAAIEASFNAFAFPGESVDALVATQNS